MVVLVVIVVQSTPERSVKLLEKKCYGCGKLKHFITMCRPRSQSQSQSKSIPHSTNKSSGTKQNQQNRSCHDFYEVNHQSNADSYDYEKDSITIVFNMQFRNKNMMFDEISSQPSLQHALTDLPCIR